MFHKIVKNLHFQSRHTMTVALFPGAVKHTKLGLKEDTSTNVSCTSLSPKKWGKLYDRTEVKICKVFQRATNE